jgi:hypothetical protein
VLDRLLLLVLGSRGISHLAFFYPLYRVIVTCHPNEWKLCFPPPKKGKVGLASACAFCVVDFVELLTFCLHVSLGRWVKRQIFAIQRCIENLICVFSLVWIRNYLSIKVEVWISNYLSVKVEVEVWYLIRCIGKVYRKRHLNKVWIKLMILPWYCTFKV